MLWRRCPVGYCRDETDTSQEVSGLIIPGGNPAEILDPTEHAFDDIALAVSGLIQREGLLAPGGARHNSPRPPLFKHEPEAVRVVALVRDQEISRGEGRKKLQCDGDVGDVARREK